MINNVVDVGNVIRPRIIDRDIPPIVFRLGTCYRKSFPRSKLFKAAQSSLTRRGAGAGMQIENQR